ncbi:MAG: DegT/DnrJ/EryC1/StrS family aminotransferase [Bacteroidota bacterium]
MKPAIQMVDLHGQYKHIQAEVDAAISKVISQSAFINGSDVKEFQKELQQYLGCSYALTCGNGTDALTLALLSLELEPGSEVITADFTFIATAEAIARVGLVPVPVDVNPDTFTIDCDKIIEAISPRTKAIMPVHLFGQAADMNRIMQIAHEHNLYVIEDAAQCFGADYVYKGHTKKLGTIGDIGCTSFFPSKNLGCFGDGGAVFTHDTEKADAIRALANHGSLKKYYHSQIGINSRLDTIQAAILRVKLQYIDAYNDARKKAAARYTELLSTISWIQTPVFQEHSTHVFHQYTITIEGDNVAFQSYLREHDIPSMIYYPVPMHEQKALFEFNPKACPVSKHLSRSVISLPMHTELSHEQIEYICEVISSYKA